MAKEPKQVIAMPELDNEHGVAQLVLSTRKMQRGLGSCAHIQFAKQGMVMFEMYGDYRQYPGTTLQAAATQKNLDTLHAANFPPVVVDVLKADALVFYARKRGGQ